MKPRTPDPLTLVDLIVDWFSEFRQTIITVEEAKEFLLVLPKAIKELQRIQRVALKKDRN